MKFEKLEKISGGAFLHRYDITYSDEKDRRFTYEMVSRDPQLDSFESSALTNRTPSSWR